MTNIKDFYIYMRQVEQDYSNCKLIDEVLNGKKRGYVGDVNNIKYLIYHFDLPINILENGNFDTTFSLKKEETDESIEVYIEELKRRQEVLAVMENNAIKAKQQEKQMANKTVNVTVNLTDDSLDLKKLNKDLEKLVENIKKLNSLGIKIKLDKD